MQTIIIGAGASGIVAGIVAAEQGQSVIIMDKNRKALKKLGVTGNGRGNVLNAGKARFYGDADFANRVLSHMPMEKVKAFLERMGIVLWTDEEGRVYPSAQQASVVVDALLYRAKRLGVRIVLSTKVEEMRCEKGQFHLTCTQSFYEKDHAKASGKTKLGALVETKQQSYFADRVIVAVGGKAAKAHGTDGTSYALMTSFGHTCTALKPALSALITDMKPLKGLEGLRVRGTFTLQNKDGETLHQSIGEALFAKDGISGIAPMQLSRFYEEGCTLHMNLSKMLTGQDDSTAWLTERMASDPDLPLSQCMMGCCALPLYEAIARQAKVSLDNRPVSACEKSQRESLGRVIGNFVVSVTGVRDFDQAQVTAGGIDPLHLSPATMQSNQQSGLYAVGEVLNVDGDCGGFNLLFAFASGMLAGSGKEGANTLRP